MSAIQKLEQYGLIVLCLNCQGTSLIEPLYLNHQYCCCCGAKLNQTTALNIGNTNGLGIKPKENLVMNSLAKLEVSKASNSRQVENNGGKYDAE